MKTSPGRSARNGFSLIELLIVVAIILIIAAIAIPSLMKSKMAANEASAAESVRTLTTGETTYSALCPNIGYSPTLSELSAGAVCASGQAVNDNVLTGGNKSGYKFVYAPTAVGGLNTAFTIVATPWTIGVTGQRGFYSDQTAVLRYTSDGSAPTAASSPLQ